MAARVASHCSTTARLPRVSSPGSASSEVARGAGASTREGTSAVTSEIGTVGMLSCWARRWRSALPGADATDREHRCDSGPNGNPSLPTRPNLGDCPRERQATIRVVIAKPGLDGHDRGAKVVARALRDAGMEVIYTGLHQTPEQIVQTVIQEDADAVGLSVLSGAHMTLFARLDGAARATSDVTDVVVFGGGIIPDADIPELEAMGVAKVFTPGSLDGRHRRLGALHVTPPRLGEPGLSGDAARLPVRA